MKITTIAYGRTFSNENFESTRIDLTAEVGPKDEIEDVFIELFDQITILRDTELDQTPKRGKR